MENMTGKRAVAKKLVLVFETRQMNDLNSSTEGVRGSGTGIPRPFQLSFHFENR